MLLTTEKIIYQSNQPLVTVVIPVYNGERYLGEALNSITNQSYKNIEVIIIDDGSTDNSLSIANTFNGRKTVVSVRNGDVSKARNEGIRLASGDFIAFLDQDDIWQKNKIEKQVQEFITNNDTDLVYTDLVKFYPSGKVHHPQDRRKYAKSINATNLFGKLCQKNVIMPSTVMVRKQSIHRAGLFDETFRTCGDYELWLRMAAMKFKFHFIDEPLTWYRFHGENTSTKIDIMHTDRIKAIESIFIGSHSGIINPRIKISALASAFIESSNGFYSSKRYSDFYRTFKTGLSYSISRVPMKSWIRFLKYIFIHRWNS